MTNINSSGTTPLNNKKMEEKLKEVYELLGRTKLNRQEQWMFDNFWNNSEFEFRKDSRGKLNVHRKDQ